MPISLERSGNVRGSNDHVDLATDEVGHQFRQSIVSPLSAAIFDQFRRAAEFVDKILRGAKPKARSRSR